MTALPSDDLEAVARAICIVAGGDPDVVYNDPCGNDLRNWHFYEPHARAAIAAWNRRAAPVGNWGTQPTVADVAAANYRAKTLERELHAARSRASLPSQDDVAHAVEALRPFAEALKRVDRGGPDNACFIGSQLTLGDLRDAETAILALMSQSGDGWLPMESAPKDGTDILVSHAINGCMFVARWDAGEAGWIDGSITGDEFNTFNPSHWRPLPAPPAKEGR